MSGFPQIGSRYNDPEGAGAPSNVIDGVYENGDLFSVDVTFRDPVVTGDAIEYRPVVLTEVSTDLNIEGVKIVKKSNDTVTISGSPTSVFVDSYYQFIMKDNSIKILPPNTKEPYLSIVKWSPPSTKYIYDVPYLIKVKYTSEATPTVTQETVTILQDIYWNYTASVNGFKALVKSGAI